MPFSVRPLEPLAQGWAHLRPSVRVLWSWGGGAGHQVRPLGHSSPIWKVVGDHGFLVQGQLYPLSLGLPVHAPPRSVHTC